MEPLAILENDDDDASIQDTPHVEIMFEALNDTIEGVSGTEGFNLTEAQVYAQGVLMASGVLRSTAVEGNEGFFSSIGSGAKSIYEYVVKMFKSVWGFFFNRDATKAAEEAKAEVKVEKQKIEVFERSSDPEAVAYAEKAMKYIQARVKKANGVVDEDTIDLDNDTMEDIKRKLEGDSSQKKAGVVKLMDLMPKVNKNAQKKFKQKAEAVVNVNKAFVAMIDQISKRQPGESKVRSDSKAGALANKLATETRAYEPIVTKNIANLIRHEEVKDKADAKRILDEITHDIEAGEKIAKNMKSHTSEISSEINAMEKLMSAGPLTPEAKSDLDALRSVLSRGTTIAQYLKRVTDAQTAMARSVTAVFGV